METTTSETLIQPKQRPTLLTVMCVLTFIVSSLSTLSGIRTIVMADSISQATSERMAEIEDKMENNSSSFVKSIMGSVTAGLSPANLQKSGAIKIIVGLLCLSGAVLMWRFKKNGFYIYIVGCAIEVLAPIILLGGLVGVIGVVSAAFFNAIACILYGLNLKEME